MRRTDRFLLLAVTSSVFGCNGGGGPSASVVTATSVASSSSTGGGTTNSSSTGMSSASSSSGGGSASSSASGASSSASGASSSSGAGGAMCESVCGANEKLCSGSCNPLDNPYLGCASQSCAPCPTNQAIPKCNQGACSIGACFPDWADCNSNVSDGCETNLKHDAGHCGNCATKCNANEICAEGSCVVTCSPPFTNCQGTCVDLVASNDPDHCGGCNTICASRTAFLRAATGSAHTRRGARRDTLCARALASI